MSEGVQQVAETALNVHALSDNFQELDHIVVFLFRICSFTATAPNPDNNPSTTHFFYTSVEYDKQNVHTVLTLGVH